VATGSDDKAARVFEATTGREVSRLAHQAVVGAVAFSPDGKLIAAQTGDWLHLYEHDGDRWRPKANRYVPLLWPGTLRFPPDRAECVRCVEVLRDVPENLLKLDRIDFDKLPTPAFTGTPEQLVSEWSAKLGLTIDARGRISPLVVPTAR
jgi:hypothetical protein